MIHRGEPAIVPPDSLPAFDDCFASVLVQAGVGVTRHERPNLCLAERRGVTVTRLQSTTPGPALAQAFADCGLTLPMGINESAGRDPAILCMASGDWLLFSEFLDFARMSKELATAVDGRHTRLLDQSSAMAAFRISGGAAPWLLQKYCGLDLFGLFGDIAHFARTRLDYAAVILHYHQPGSGGGPFVFDLLFDRSLARYLWQLLLTAAPHAEELFLRYGKPR